jgi:hypothetical protein
MFVWDIFQDEGYGGFHFLRSIYNKMSYILARQIFRSEPGIHYPQVQNANPRTTGIISSNYIIKTEFDPDWYSIPV